jgi:hypothetical protein
LRRAADLKERIDALQDELDELLGAPMQGAAVETPTASMRRKVSAAARARMKKAQKDRWAKLKANQTGPAVKAAPKGKFSPVARRRLSELAKARWAARRAAGKTRL